MSGTVLAIETSTPMGSIAVLSKTGGVIFSESFESKRSHNSLLFDPLKRALKAVASLETVVVGTGPGSYTGVRIGIAAAQGVSIAKKIPIFGISSLGAVDPSPSDGNFIVAGDARRGSYFWAEIRDRQLVGESTLCSATELAALSQKTSTPILTCDQNPLPVPSEQSFPSAAQLGKVFLAMPIGSDSDKPIEPIYLRAPYVTTPKPKGHPTS